MSNLLVTDFDFTGKRVRDLQTGKCLSNYDIAYLIDMVKYQYAVLNHDVYDYKYMRDWFFNCLTKI